MWEYLAFSFVAVLASIFLATAMGCAAQGRLPWVNAPFEGGKRPASGKQTAISDGQTAPGAF